MRLAEALHEWRTLLGAASVLDNAEAMSRYGADCGGASRNVPAALTPDTAEQVRAIVLVAARYAVPIYPISTGNNWGYGSSLPALGDCVLLDLSRLDRIVAFDAELGVVTVEPGVTQGMLADHLARCAQPFLVPTTGAGPSCSLVGNALERGYGITPYSDHFSAVTDIEAVLADGTVFRTAMHDIGSEDLARLFKWGVGPYLPGLFTQGNFGIVTRMSIALARRPDVIKVCLFGLREDHLLESCVERVRHVLARMPGAVGGLNLMNRHRVLAMSAPYPNDQLAPSGLIPGELVAAMGDQYQALPWTGFGTLYGTRATVNAAQTEIRKALRGIASRLVFVSPNAALQLGRVTSLLPGRLGRAIGRTARTLSKSLELVSGHPNETALPLAYWQGGDTSTEGRRNPAKDGCGLIWYAPLVPMRPEQVRYYVQMVTRTTTAHGLEPLITLTSLSERIFDSTVPLLFNRDTPEALLAAQACYEELIVEGRKIGCFPYRLGIDAMHHFSSASSTAVLSRLRAAFDPNGLIAPGRYLP